MGISSRAGSAPLGALRTTVTAPSSAATLRMPESRPAKRDCALRARLREVAASSAVRGVPSENVTPLRSWKLQVRPSSLTL